MTSVSFYHVQTKSIYEVVPELLEKAIEADLRICVRLPQDFDVKALSKAIWTHNPASFLPHTIDSEGEEDINSPILLSAGSETPESLNALFVVNNASWNQFERHNRCFYLFDGKSSLRVEEAREKWKALKDAGVSMRYLQQDDSGKWSEKATA